MIKLESTYSAFGNSFSPSLIFEEVEITKIQSFINEFEDEFGQKSYPVVVVSKDQYKVTLQGGIEVYNALQGIKNSRELTLTQLKDNVVLNTYTAVIREISDIDLANNTIEFDFTDENSEIIQNLQDQTVKNDTHTKLELTLLDSIFEKSKSNTVTIYTNLPILDERGEPTIDSSTDTGEEIVFGVNLTRTKQTRFYLSESEVNELEDYIRSSTIELTPVTDGTPGTTLTNLTGRAPIIEKEEISHRIFSLTLTITTESGSTNNFN